MESRKAAASNSISTHVKMTVTGIARGYSGDRPYSKLGNKNKVTMASKRVDKGPQLNPEEKVNQIN